MSTPLKPITSLLYEMDHTLGLPVAYSHFNSAQKPPYCVYTGAGQNALDADDTYYWRRDTYSLEYYFEKKDAAKEASIEDTILANGWKYTKSDDVYIETDGVYVIYYDLN